MGKDGAEGLSIAALVNRKIYMRGEYERGPEIWEKRCAKLVKNVG
jgi:hypothetical protein